MVKLFGEDENEKTKRSPLTRFGGMNAEKMPWPFVSPTAKHTPESIKALFIRKEMPLSTLRSMKQEDSEHGMPEGGKRKVCRYFRGWLHLSQVMEGLGRQRTVKQVFSFAKTLSTDWMATTYSI